MLPPWVQSVRPQDIETGAGFKRFDSPSDSCYCRNLAISGGFGLDSDRKDGEPVSGQVGTRRRRPPVRCRQRTSPTIP